MADVPQSESSTKKKTSSVQDVGAEKPPFGSRFLTDEADVWSQNAWDHVPAPDDQVEAITNALEKQKLNPVPAEEKIRYNEKPAKHWDNFYKMNASNFFRNRKWLHNEFPDLVAATQAGAGPFTIAEIGCGAGNSAFPLLASNANPDLHLHAYDYSSHAVKLVQHNPLYTSPPMGSIHASVWDLASKGGIPSDLQPGTVDIVVLVFVLSALHPDEWTQAISNIHTMLKPGGLVVIRDYGRYDLTQLRFKGGRLLDDNFYIRGDKTRVYFFELDELSFLFTGRKATAADHASSKTVIEDEEESNGDSQSPQTAPSTPFADSPESIEASGSFPLPEVSSDINSTGEANLPQAPSNTPLPTSIHPNLLSSNNLSRHPLFSTKQLGVDRRLLINRKRQLKMYRVWVQGQFRKLG